MRRCKITQFLYIFLSHYYLQSAIVSCGRLKIVTLKKYIGGIINVKSNAQCHGAPQSLSSFTPRELPCQFFKSTVEPTYSEPWMLHYSKQINFGEIPCLQPHQSCRHLTNSLPHVQQVAPPINVNSGPSLHTSVLKTGMCQKRVDVVGVWHGTLCKI